MKPKKPGEEIYGRTVLALDPNDLLILRRQFYDRDDKLVKVWDVNAGTAKDAAGHTVAVLAVAADPNGKVLLSGGADKSVRGWNPATGEPTKVKFDGTSAVCAIAVSPDAKRAAVGLASGKLQAIDWGVSDKTSQWTIDLDDIELY